MGERAETGGRGQQGIPPRESCYCPFMELGTQWILELLRRRRFDQEESPIEGQERERETEKD
jgi:hypothetical protein